VVYAVIVAAYTITDSELRHTHQNWPDERINAALEYLELSQRIDVIRGGFETEYRDNVRGPG
jgi:hypothetical protein